MSSVDSRNSAYTGLRIVLYPSDLLKEYTRRYESIEYRFNKRGQCVDSVNICKEIITKNPCDDILLCENGYEDLGGIHLPYEYKIECDSILQKRLSDLCEWFNQFISIELKWAYILHNADFHSDDFGKLIPDVDHYHIVLFTSDRDKDNQSIDFFKYQDRIAFTLGTLTESKKQLDYFEYSDLPKEDFIECVQIPFLRNYSSMQYLGGALRYLPHFNDSSKHQYSLHDIHSNFDIYSLSCFADEVRKVGLDKLMDFILTYPTCSYLDVYLYAKENCLQNIFAKYQWQIMNSINNRQLVVYNKNNKEI